MDVPLPEQVTDVDARDPLTVNPPASTNVSPSYVLSPERIRVPWPAFLRSDEAVDPEIIPLKVASEADWLTVSSLLSRLTEPAPVSPPIVSELLSL